MRPSASWRARGDLRRDPTKRPYLSHTHTHTHVQTPRCRQLFTCANARSIFPLAFPPWDPTSQRIGSLIFLPKKSKLTGPKAILLRFEEPQLACVSLVPAHRIKLIDPEAGTPNRRNSARERFSCAFHDQVTLPVMLHRARTLPQNPGENWGRIQVPNPGPSTSPNYIKKTPLCRFDHLGYG